MPTAVASAYHESSQFKRWTLSIEDLAERRARVNSSTIQEIQSNMAEELQLTSKAPEKPADFPTAEEELLIVNYYASKVFDTGAVFNLPSHAKATAAAYFKRFFLVRSPLQYHPKNIMITSLFLTTKTCEHHIDLDTFVSKLPKQTKELVLEHEFLISSTIQFDYVHWSPYRPLHGFILDMESNVAGESLKEVNTIHETAKKLLSACAWSDLAFLYSPSHLALAALYNSNANLLSQYLEKKGLTGLLPSLENIARQLKDTSNIRFDSSEMMTKVKAADKKLYYSKDPALKKDSALYKRRLEEEENKEGAKRRKKGDAARESQEAFGDVLS